MELANYFIFLQICIVTVLRGCEGCNAGPGNLGFFNFGTGNLGILNFGVGNVGILNQGLLQGGAMNTGVAQIGLRNVGAFNVKPIPNTVSVFNIPVIPNVVPFTGRRRRRSTLNYPNGKFLWNHQN